MGLRKWSSYQAKCDIFPSFAQNLRRDSGQRGRQQIQRPQEYDRNTDQSRSVSLLFLENSIFKRERVMGQTSQNSAHKSIHRKILRHIKRRKRTCLLFLFLEKVHSFFGGSSFETSRCDVSENEFIYLSVDFHAKFSENQMWYRFGTTAGALQWRFTLTRECTCPRSSSDRCTPLPITMTRRLNASVGPFTSLLDSSFLTWIIFSS